LIAAYLWFLTRVLSTFAHEAIGASRTRHFLYPLSYRGWFAQQLVRYLRREKAESYPLSRLKFNRYLQRILAADDRAIAPAAGLRGVLLAEIPSLAWANRFRLDRQVSH
jgi:hypothetical protein